MSVSDTLNLAADLIEERGWLQAPGDGTIGDWWGLEDAAAPLCIEGGLIAALGGLDDGETDPKVAVESCPAYVAVCGYLNWDSNLFIWNDRHERTATEVIEVLRATALIESARERETAEATR